MNNHIKEIYNLIDVEQYDVKREDDGYALYVGRLSKEKGILNLIEAFSKLEEGKLYIAGDGPEKEKINQDNPDAYCTTDFQDWICLQCYEDFKEQFQWKTESDSH